MFIKQQYIVYSVPTCIQSTVLCCDLELSHVTFFPQTSVSGLTSSHQVGSQSSHGREVKGICWENVDWGGEGKGVWEDVLLLERMGCAVCHLEIRT